MIGFEASTFASTWVCSSACDPPTMAKYRIAYLADTVLPAPDSPLTMIDWFCSNLQQRTYFKLTEIITYYKGLAYYSSDRNSALYITNHTNIQATLIK